MDAWIWRDVADFSEFRPRFRLIVLSAQAYNCITGFQMQAASKILISLSGLIFLGVGAVVLLMLQGNEAAIWVGGWGLLFLGMPLLVTFLICLFVGLALRMKPASADSHEQGMSIWKRRPFAWVTVCAGLTLLAILGLQLTLAFSFVETSLWWVPILSVVFDLKLPVALGALAFGWMILRGAHHVVD